MRIGGMFCLMLAFAVPAFAQEAQETPAPEVLEGEAPEPEPVIDPGQPDALSPNELPPPVVPSLDEDTLIIIDDSDDAPMPEPLVVEDDSHTPMMLFAGEVASRLYVDTAFNPTGEDVIEWWNLGRLRLDYRVLGRFRAYLEGWIRWGGVAEDAANNNGFFLVNGSNAKWATDIQLREGYVEMKLDSFLFKVGQRIFVWGKNELFPVADLINPIDLRYDPLAIFNSPRDAKVPVFAAEATYLTGDYSLSLVLVPFFEPHRAFLFGRDLALAPPGSPQLAQLSALDAIDPSIEDEIQRGLVGTRLPDESPQNASVALRGTARPLGWDVAATAYFGWDRTPTLFVDPDALVLIGALGDITQNPAVLATDPTLRAASLAVQQKATVGQELVRARYDRLWVFALETQGIVGDFVARLDVGASPEQTFLTNDFTSLRRPSSRVTAGLEYAWGETFYGSATGYTVMVWNPPANQRLVGIEDTNEPAHKRDLAALYGVSATLRYTLSEAGWAFDATGLYNIAPGDVLATARVGYKVYQDQEVNLGVFLAHGVRGSAAYVYRNSDFVYVQYKATF